jgi:hypothetical protein
MTEGPPPPDDVAGNTPTPDFVVVVADKSGVLYVSAAYLKAYVESLV